MSSINISTSEYVDLDSLEEDTLIDLLSYPKTVQNELLLLWKTKLSNHSISHQESLYFEVMKGLDKLMDDILDDAFIQTFGTYSLVDLTFLLQDNTDYSEYLFPNEPISVTPFIEIRRSRHDRICHISGSPIYQGDVYCRYKPIIHRIQPNKFYTISKAICTSPYYETILPSDIQTLELWHHNLATRRSTKEIDFEEFSVNYGDHLFPVVILKTKPKIKVKTQQNLVK